MLTVAAEFWIVLAVCLLLGIAFGWWAWSRRGRRIEIERPAAAPTPTLRRVPTTFIEPPSPIQPLQATPGTTMTPHPAQPPDDLLQMKGVGPKLAGVLRTLGITRYEQIAAWTDDDVARIDGQLGNFQGRIVRDRWIEQAKFLAVDDREGFERAFGRIDGAQL